MEHRTLGRWQNFLLMIGLLAIGLFIRWVGINWCFPLLGHSDEPIIVGNAVRMLSAGTWDPKTYGHPDHLSIYLHAIMYKAMTVPTGETVAEAFARVPLSFYRASRLLNGFLSAGLILVAYGLGRRLSQRHAWLAAVFVTFFPSFIEHGYYATSDIPLTLFMALNVYGCVCFSQSGRTAPLYAGAACGALALTVKYPGTVSVLVVAAAVVVQPGLNVRRRAQILVRAAAVFLLTAFAAAPYLFLHFDQVLTSVAFESQVRQVGASGLPAWATTLFYMQEYGRRAGVVLSCLSLLGYGVILRRHRELGALAGFGLLFLVFISLLGRYWERWGLPSFFCSCVAAAVGAVWLWERSASRPVLRWFVMTALVVGGLNLMVQSTYLARVFCLPDTRVVSLYYCQANRIAKKQTLFETYTAFAPRLVGHFARLTPDQLTGDYLKQKRIRYIATSSWVSDRFLRGYSPDPAEAVSYELVARFELVKRFPSLNINRMFWYDSSFFEPVNIFRLTRALAQIDENSMSGPNIDIYRVPKNLR